MLDLAISHKPDVGVTAGTGAAGSADTGGAIAAKATVDIAAGV